MPAISLNLAPLEFEALQTLSKRKNLSMAHILRRSLRFYYLLERRMQEGEKLMFLRVDGTYTDGSLWPNGVGWEESELK